MLNVILNYIRLYYEYIIYRIKQINKQIDCEHEWINITTDKNMCGEHWYSDYYRCYKCNLNYITSKQLDKPKR